MTNSTKEKLKDLLVQESANLSLIQQRLKVFNIFDVLGVGHRELQHSNFIGWLLDPNGNHGFGDYFLLEFLNQLSDVPDELLIDCHLGNLYSTRVKRESENNIDIFIINNELSFCIAIENKVLAGESAHQLAKYKKHVLENHDDLNHQLFVFLTPNGILPKAEDMQESYETLSYFDLVLMLKGGLNSFGENVEPDIEYAIKQYIANVNRNIIGMDDAVKTAQKIYQEHRQAIDFIYRNRPDCTSLMDEAIKYVHDHPKLLLQVPDDKRFVRFMPNHEGFNSLFRYPAARSWGEGCDYIFMFELHFSKQAVLLKLCFGAIYIADIEQRQEVQEAKDKLFTEMKKEPLLKPYLSKARSSSKYPGIAWLNIMSIEDFHKDDSEDMVEVFRRRFGSVVSDLILPFSDAFASRMSDKPTKA
ncbi:PD-(D/E)XK nuclease family protein [Phaeodactylibacter xiamenensis]|uniref:PDDEXK-like family protein n=1 Tax=Phaeodactylibacter xiamenensis TaxID=1524460 RepID=UPI0024A85FA0|nr:PD-(D/E)XK nuclease family protein [Phaeodactylibacter xiamenensis]